MKYAQAFPTAFYKAADLSDEGLVLTIAAVTTESLPDGTERRCLKFREGSKKLGLNRTNFLKCVEVIGKDDDDEWVGARIRLEKQKVQFRGDVVDAVRVTTPDVPF